MKALDRNARFHFGSITTKSGIDAYTTDYTDVPSTYPSWGFFPARNAFFQGKRLILLCSGSNKSSIHAYTPNYK